MSVHSEAGNTEERRSFLGILTGLIAAGISAVFGVSIGRFALGPAFSKAGEAAWTEAGALAEIPEGQLVKRSLTVPQVAGWGNFTAERAVWVIRSGEDIKVFSAVCPHLGCTVTASTDKFLCACHNSTWDQAGTTLGGPSPRGLDSLEHRVEGGKLQIRYQDFKQGTPTKEALS